MSPAQLARLNAARRLPNSATVAIVLDEYAALIPTLRAADSVPALQGEIAHLRSALTAQVAATEAERAAAAKAKAHADEVRKSLQAGKATAESRALRAEAALSETQAELIAKVAALTEMLPVCKQAGCSAPHYAKRLCRLHYLQVKRKEKAAPCIVCGQGLTTGESGRCRQCYVAALMAGGRDASKRDRIEVAHV
jgi:hypothetical protein